MFVDITLEDLTLPNDLKRYDFMWSLYENDVNISNGSFEYVEGEVEIAPLSVK